MNTLMHESPVQLECVC